MRSAILSLILLLFVSSTSFGARLDTSFRFSTIETPHFSIHFHQGLDPVARKAAVFAEEAYRNLVGEFGWRPREKTQLILIDDSDFTNGMAITIPYNTIYVEVVPPSLASTLGEYDDWLREIVTHEYAHIVTSDPARGYWKVTRSIFGKPLPWLGDPFTELMFLVTAPPNTFMPRWWHEGMATWSESQFTGQGRGKGTFYDMVFRSAVAENHIPRVDEINGDVPYWPNGNLPYMFGYRLQRYIADTYGKEALGTLSIAQSGRFPYFINNPPEELTGGRSYRDLYQDMVAAMTAEQSQKIAILSKAPFTPVTTISRAGENLTNPRFSPDGSRIAFTRRDPNDHTMVVIADRNGRELGTFRRRYSDGSLAWSPDGQRLYFTQTEINRGYDFYEDLYVYDVRGEKVTRLTHRQRLSDIDLSPDGTLLAAAASYRGSQSLVITEIGASRKEPASRVVAHYPLQRVSSPHWSPDGRMLCYALRDNAGHTDLRLYDLAAGTDQALFTGNYSIEYPIWSRDGSCIFYISDETGVFNLFAYDVREGRSYQVSHLLTGALQPDPSPDGRTVAVSMYTAYGFYIAEMTLDRAKWSATRGPSLPLSRGTATGAGSQSAAPLKAASDLQPAEVGSSATTSGPAAISSSKVWPYDNPAGKPSVQPRPHPSPEQHGALDGTAGDTMPAIGNINDATAPGAADAGTPTLSADTALALPAHRYNPLKTLYPHFWLPRISDDGSGKAVIGAFTAGADVLGYNSYLLAADYSSGRKRGYFDFIYNNDYLYPTFSLLAHAQPFLYSDLERRGDYRELNQGFTVEATVPINFLERRYLFNAGYELLDQQALSHLDQNGLFNGIKVFKGRRDNVFAGVAFENALKYPYSISYEEGRRISFLYRRFARAIGSSQDLSEYSAEYREFLRLPTEPLKHHVIYLRLSGALADGDLQYGQQAFQIGGIPSDLNPYPLRGYPERFSTGKYVATGTLEYRAPIFYPMHGPGTFPLFFEKLHGALFVDAGEVWDDHNTFNGNKVKVGAGAEIRTDITLGYWAKITPALGFAHGFNQGGENQIYLTVYVDL